VPVSEEDQRRPRERHEEQAERRRRRAADPLAERRVERGEDRDADPRGQHDERVAERFWHHGRLSSGRAV
jgi:hypothetical protein